MGVYDLEPVEDAAPTGESKKSLMVDGSSRVHVENEVVLEGAAESSLETAKENGYEKMMERANAQATASSVAQRASSGLSEDAKLVVSVDESSRIEKLVSIALEKGPEQAFRVAIELDDMYALDMLHDRLSHQLYDELVSKGFLASE